MESLRRLAPIGTSPHDPIDLYIFFFFFGVVASTGCAGWDTRTGRITEHREEMLYAPAAWQPCVGLLVFRRTRSYVTAPTGAVHKIPTKTPLFLYQSSGRLSSSLRLPDHVLMTRFLSSALLPNLRSSVRYRSVVSLLFIVYLHLAAVSAADVVSRSVVPLDNNSTI